jgi:hypothetical protein
MKNGAETAETEKTARPAATRVFLKRLITYFLVRSGSIRLDPRQPALYGERMTGLKRVAVFQVRSMRFKS